MDRFKELPVLFQNKIKKRSSSPKDNLLTAEPKEPETEKKSSAASSIYSQSTVKFTPQGIEVETVVAEPSTQYIQHNPFLTQSELNSAPPEIITTRPSTDESTDILSKKESKEVMSDDPEESDEFYFDRYSTEIKHDFDFDKSDDGPSTKRFQQMCTRTMVDDALDPPRYVPPTLKDLVGPVVYEELSAVTQMAIYPTELEGPSRLHQRSYVLPLRVTSSPSWDRRMKYIEDIERRREYLRVHNEIAIKEFRAKRAYEEHLQKAREEAQRLAHEKKLEEQENEKAQKDKKPEPETKKEEKPTPKKTPAKPKPVQSYPSMIASTKKTLVFFFTGPSSKQIDKTPVGSPYYKVYNSDWPPTVRVVSHEKEVEKVFKMMKVIMQHQKLYYHLNVRADYPGCNSRVYIGHTPPEMPQNIEEAFHLKIAQADGFHFGPLPGKVGYAILHPDFLSFSVPGIWANWNSEPYKPRFVLPSLEHVADHPEPIIIDPAFAYLYNIMTDNEKQQIQRAHWGNKICYSLDDEGLTNMEVVGWKVPPVKLLYTTFWTSYTLHMQISKYLKRVTQNVKTPRISKYIERKKFLEEKCDAFAQVVGDAYMLAVDEALSIDTVFQRGSNEAYVKAFYWFMAQKPRDWGYLFLKYANVKPSELIATPQFGPDTTKEMMDQHPDSVSFLHSTLEKSGSRGDINAEKLLLVIICSVLNGPYFNRFLLRALLFSVRRSVVSGGRSREALLKKGPRGGNDWSMISQIKSMILKDNSSS